MRPILAILPLLATLTSAKPLPHPQELTVSEFRSLRDEATPNNKVDITNGYATIRRQGRRLGDGETFDYKRPLPVRVNFAAGTGRQFADSFNARPKKFTRMDVGPVFNLEDMLRKEAAKLKAKVQEASLKAAKAAEEAEKKLEDMVRQVVEETDTTRDEVESIIEEAVESGIEEAENIIEEELKEEEEEKIREELEDSLDEDENVVDDVTTEPSSKEPSGEIDLGSVQEV